MGREESEEIKICWVGSSCACSGCKWVVGTKEWRGKMWGSEEKIE